MMTPDFYLVTLRVIVSSLKQIDEDHNRLRQILRKACHCERVQKQAGKLDQSPDPYPITPLQLWVHPSPLVSLRNYFNPIVMMSCTTPRNTMRLMVEKPLDYNGFRPDDDGEVDVDGSIYDDDVAPVWVHDDRVVGNYASTFHRKLLSRVSGSLLCALDLQYAHIQKKN